MELFREMNNEQWNLWFKNIFMESVRFKWFLKMSWGKKIAVGSICQGEDGVRIGALLPAPKNSNY